MHQYRSVPSNFPAMNESLLIVLENASCDLQSHSLPSPIINRLASPDHLILINQDEAIQAKKLWRSDAITVSIKSAIILTKAMTPLVHQTSFDVTSRKLSAYVVIVDEESVSERDQMQLAISGSIPMSLDEFIHLSLQCS